MTISYFFTFSEADSLQLEGCSLLSPLFNFSFFIGVYILKPFTAFLLVVDWTVLLLICVWSLILSSDGCDVFWLEDCVLDECCGGGVILFSDGVGGWCNCGMVFCFSKIWEKLGIKWDFLTPNFFHLLFIIQSDFLVLVLKIFFFIF